MVWIGTTKLCAHEERLVPALNIFKEAGNLDTILSKQAERLQLLEKNIFEEQNGTLYIRQNNYSTELIYQEVGNKFPKLRLPRKRT